MKTEKIQSGIAGEYFVAGELSRRGIVASLTLRNTADIDIVATNLDSYKTANIQVKTRRIDKAEGWDMGSKPLEIKREWNSAFYVFVALSSKPEDKNIDYYIVPKNLLNKEVETFAQNWRMGTKKSGKPRTSKRRFFRLKELPKFTRFKDKWEIF